MYSIHIYLFIYSDSLIFGKMYDKETFYSAEYIYFHFICKFYLCLKKSWLPLLDHPEKKWPPSINCQFLMTPYLFAPPSLEINNDWSLISIITYQNVVVKTNNNSNIIITIIAYNNKMLGWYWLMWGRFCLGRIWSGGNFVKYRGDIDWGDLIRYLYIYCRKWYSWLWYRRLRVIS